MIVIFGLILSLILLMIKFTKGKKTININKEVSKVNKKDDTVHLKRPYSYNIVFNNGSLQSIYVE